jgi:hypothetical protein
MFWDLRLRFWAKVKSSGLGSGLGLKSKEFGLGLKSQNVTHLYLPRAWGLGCGV